MNMYKVLCFLLFVIIASSLFNLGPAFEQLANGIANIPLFEDKGEKPFIFDLGVRCMYLITLVGIVKIIFGTKNNE